MLRLTAAVVVDPPVPHGYQGVFAGGTISLFQKRPLTLGQVISEVPLSRVASFIRAITNSADSAMLEKQVDKNRRARDKLALHKTLDVSTLTSSDCCCSHYLPSLFVTVPAAHVARLDRLEGH